MKIRDIMTTDVISVTPETSLKDVGLILKTKRISGVPVVTEEGSVVGIITLTDMMKVLARIYQWKTLEKGDSTLSFSEKYEDEKNNAKVEDFMSRDVMTLTEDASLEFLHAKMFKSNIHTLPVMKDGNLVGIVGKRDLICACF